MQTTKTKTINTTGRRKRAIAKARLREGKGIIKINNIPLDFYNPELARLRIQEPLIIAQDTANKVDIKVNVEGGGWSAQADAVRLAIARSLAEFNKSLKQQFLAYDRSLIVADVRQAEASKPNDSKPRAKRQKSYR